MKIAETEPDSVEPSDMDCKGELVPEAVSAYVIVLDTDAEVEKLPAADTDALEHAVEVTL